MNRLYIIISRWLRPALRQIITAEVNNGRYEVLSHNYRSYGTPFVRVLVQEQTHRFQRHLYAVWWIRHRTHLDQVLLLYRLNG
jgi:hypothetical protein